MIIRSTLSILGLYQYDNGVFEHLRVPEGMDLDIVKNDILSECAELEIIYPDPNVVKELIRNWVTAELPIWERQYQAATADFNPLYNVDAWESNKIERELEGENHISGENHTTSGNIGSTVGYNTEEWKNKDKDDGQEDSNHLNDGENSEKETIVETRRRYGNIGVTKSTELLRDAWAVYPLLNVYKYIVSSFKDRFCIEVY